MPKMTWTQREIQLKPKPRGFHLITHEVCRHLSELHAFRVGLVHILIQHTSAALSLNENADPSVRTDMATFFDRWVPERAAFFTHTAEGPDDMPAHIKAVVLGPSLTLPIRDGALQLGTWQGIYLCEFRNHGGPRRLIVTLNGETQPP